MCFSEPEPAPLCRAAAASAAQAEATPAGDGLEGSKPGKNSKPTGKGKNGAGLVEGEIPNEETGGPEREPGDDDLTSGL
jgi:hypothetical protein